MIKPLLFRILVKPFTVEQSDPVFAAAKAAGLEIARTEARIRTEQAVDRGIVIAIGPTAFKEWADFPVVNVGDDIFFAKYAGKILKDPYTEELFLALNDEDLIAKVEKE